MMTELYTAPFGRISVRKERLNGTNVLTFRLREEGDALLEDREAEGSLNYDQAAKLYFWLGAVLQEMQYKP